MVSFASVSISMNFSSVSKVLALKFTTFREICLLDGFFECVRFLSPPESVGLIDINVRF